MQVIRDLAEEIRDELDGAGEYAKKAAHFKGTDDSLAAMYSEIAGQELGHVDKLHSKAMEIIKKYRAEKGDPPKAMQAVWDWEHKAMIQRMAEIKGMLEMLRK